MDKFAYRTEYSMGSHPLEPVLDVSRHIFSTALALTPESLRNTRALCFDLQTAVLVPLRLPVVVDSVDRRAVERGGASAGEKQTETQSVE